MYNMQDSTKEPTIEEIPADYVDKANEYRQLMLNNLANFDEDIMMAVLGGEEPTVEQIKKAIRAGTITGEFFPVFCGSAYKNKGVRLLLDGVIDYLPSPVDVPATEGTDEKGNVVKVEATDDAPFCGLAFKIMTDPFVGRLCFFRAYSGIAKTGTYVYNTNKATKERFSRLVLMHADKRQDVDSISAGEIGAAVGLKVTGTGDTLCDESRILSLETIVFSEPVISEAIEPASKADQDKMTAALLKLQEEDPTFRFYTDAETGQNIIAGVGELQLDVNVTRLRDDFGVKCNVGAPQVAYRETIKKTGECEGCS